MIEEIKQQLIDKGWKILHWSDHSILLHRHPSCERILIYPDDEICAIYYVHEYYPCLVEFDTYILLAELMKELKRKE